MDRHSPALIGLLSLGACAPPVGIGAWEQAVVDCAISEDSNPWRDPLPEPLSLACEARLTVDFGVDVDAEHRDHVLTGLFTLAATGQGVVADVRESALVSAEMVFQLERHGAPEDPVQGVLYGLAAQRIEQILDAEQTRPEILADFIRPRREITVRPPAYDEASVTFASLVVHEMWHADGWKHRPCSFDETLDGCDRTPNGAYGAQAGWYALAVPPLREHAFAVDAVEAKAWEWMERIEP